MKEFLFFQLYAPMISWGETAVGEIRSTQYHPSKSAILGLIAAAMGVKRSEEKVLIDMTEGYGMCTFTRKEGTLLRDYHTVQSPSSKKNKEFHSRREELTEKSYQLNTLLTSREYLNDAFYYIGLGILNPEFAPYSLNQLREGLNTPGFALYLGRKSCPPALPFQPQIIEADFIDDAFRECRFGVLEEIKGYLGDSDCYGVSWEEGIPVKEFCSLKTIKIRDQLISRSRWQFTERRQFAGTWNYCKGD